jgi:DDE superfamily endonuclease
VQSFDVGGAALVGGAAFGGGHPVRVGLHGSGIRAEAPGLEEALERAVREGTPYVILDGTIVSSDRCQAKTVSRKGREIDLWYAGKKDFGGNIQGLFYPDGLPMWVSDVLPGNAHDLAAARETVLPVLRTYTGKMPALADCGYEGAGHGVLTPAKKPRGVTELDVNARTRNMLLSSARFLGERGFALLSQRWKTLQNVTASPSQIGPIARAALVLMLFEHKRGISANPRWVPIGCRSCCGLVVSQHGAGMPVLAGSRRRRCRTGSAAAGGAGRRSRPGRPWRSAAGRRC